MKLHKLHFRFRGVGVVTMMTQPLDDNELQLISLLNVGFDHAIRAKKLAVSLQLHERQVRSCVEHLIVEHKIPIGTSPDTATGGFYIAKTQHDFEVSIRHQRSRIDKQLSRIRTFEELRKQAVGV